MQRKHKGGVFVTKIDAADCALVYSTFLGGGEGLAIGIDALGEAYITGVAFSSDFPLKNAIQAKLKSNQGNAFVSKIDAAGNALIYSTYLGGTTFDVGTGIAVDAHDNAYVTGNTSSVDFPTEHAFQETLKGSADAFVTKFDAAGSLVYSTYLGGSNQSGGTGIAVDDCENA